MEYNLVKPLCLCTIVCLAIIYHLPVCAIQLSDLESPPKITNGPVGSPKYTRWNRPEGDRVKVYVRQGSEEPVELACVARSDVKPKVTYEWTKNGEKLDIDDPKYINPKTNTSRYIIKGGIGTLVIYNASKIDVGDYQCAARNKHGKSLSVIAEIVLSVPVAFKEKKEIEYNPFLGSHLTLHCHPPEDMVPPPELWWTTSETDLKKYNNSERVVMDYNGDLHFANIIPKDNIVEKFSTYKCVAKNVFLGQYIQGRAISIVPKAAKSDFPTDIMYNSSRVVKGIRGEDVKFMCIFKGNPTPTIKWRKVGANDLGPRSKLQDFNHELLIKNVDFTDQGRYVCEGTNNVTSQPKVITFSLTVEAKPTWQIQPKDVEVSVDGNATFQCKATGMPPPTVKWFINGIPIENVTNSRRQLRNNILTFRDLQEDDSQVIQCNATNKHGSLFADFFLRVLAMKPVIERSFGLLKVANGNSVTLTCPNTGFPRPEMSWYKGAQKLLGEGFILKDDSITILNSTEKNNGTYICVAINKLGRDQREGVLIVRGNTRITIPPRDKEYAENSTNVPFTCAAMTDPQERKNLTYRWLKDNEEIVPSRTNNYQITKKNKLVIRKVTRKDSGNYTCVASNGLDSDSKTATLKIKASPDPPTNVRVTQCNTSLSLKWTPGSDNFVPITNYMVEYTTSFNKGQWEELRQTNSRTPEVLDLPLSPWVNYTFRVIAENGLGRSNPSDSQGVVCRTPPSRPERHPVDVQFKKDEDGKLIINWEQMGPMEHNGPGFKYIIEVRKDKSAKTMLFTKEWTDTQLTIQTNDTYQLYRVTVEASNAVGECQKQLHYYAGYSGMGKPTVVPGNFELQPDKPLTHKFAYFQWDGVDETSFSMKGKFEGYVIRYWNEETEDYPKLIKIDTEHLNNLRQKRAVPEKVKVRVKLPAYSELFLDVVARNTYFQSNASNVINVTTPEGVPDKVYQIQINHRGINFVTLSWFKPRLPNGIITKYLIAYQKVEGLDVGPISKPTEKFVPDMGPDDIIVHRVDNLEPNVGYRLYVSAATSTGVGPNYTLDFETAQIGLPVTPVIEGFEAGSDSINISWSVPVHQKQPTGLIHFARYRPLGKGNEDFVEVKPGKKTENWQVINGLEPGVTYEVEVVAYNDEAYISSSARKEITTRGTRGYDVATGGGGVLQATWFIIIMVCLAIIILVLIIVCFVKRSREKNYNVQEREKLHGIDQDDKKGTHFHDVDENGEKQPLAGSPDYDPDKGGADSEKDSLEDYGDVDPSKFNEDGSFIGQYGPDKTTASDVAPPMAML